MTNLLICNGHLSPDLNLIENVWFECKGTVHNHRPKDLERFCMKDWSKTTLQYIFLRAVILIIKKINKILRIQYSSLPLVFTLYQSSFLILSGVWVILEVIISVKIQFDLWTLENNHNNAIITWRIVGGLDYSSYSQSEVVLYRQL